MHCPCSLRQSHLYRATVCGARLWVLLGAVGGQTHANPAGWYGGGARVPRLCAICEDSLESAPT